MAVLSKIGLGELESRSGREKATFFFLIFMSVFLFMDQNLTGPNLSAIGEDLIIKRSAVEEELARSNAEYRSIRQELEAKRSSIHEFQTRIEGMRLSILKRNPLLEKKPAELIAAVSAEAEKTWSAPEIEVFAQAARLQDKLNVKVTEEFNKYCDRIAGHASLWFWLLGGTVAILVGYLTDKFPRKILLFITIIIGEVPCLLTGYAKTESEFIFLRALTGIGIGAVLPLTYSLLGDLFSAKARSSAVAWIGLAQGIGIAGGQLLAGFMGPNPDFTWRFPFIAVAVPNFVLAFLFLFLSREPGRGSSEHEFQAALESGGEYEERIKFGDLKKIFTNRTNVLVFLQGIPGTVPWGFFFAYLPDFYHSNKGYTVEDATLLITIFGGGAILGGFIGGIIGNWLYNKKPSYLPMLCAATTLIGIIPILVVVNWSSSDISPLATSLHYLGGLHITQFSDLLFPILCGFFGGAIVTVTGANVKAVLIDVNVPENRGTIFSFFNLSDDLGKGLGPFIIGIILVQAFGRVIAYNIAILMWIFCGAIWIILVRVFPADELKLHAVLKERAARIK